MLTRLALGLMWLVHFLPGRILAALGSAFGTALYALGRERRTVALINLAMCFPEMAVRERVRLARRHFRAFGQSFLGRAVLWWGTRHSIEQWIRVEGIEHLAACAGQPVVVLAPHFVGLDAGWTRLAIDRALVSMYGRQKNAVFDRTLLQGRLRFGTSRLYSRQESIRPVLKAMREGLPFYYLPDLDFGGRDAIFAPFFGVEAATVTGLARISAITGAVVVPCVTRQLPRGAGYVVRFYPAWEGFPAGDSALDVRRMNAFIEARVQEMPEQYYWLHKRFKTRPAGHKSPYERAK